MGRRVVAFLAAGAAVGAFTTAEVGPASAAPSLNAPCVVSPSDSSQVVCTYSYTGDEQQFAVPSGVTSVTVDAVGAAGGASYGIPGGSGAEVSGVVAVPAGVTTLYVEVGGVGAGAVDGGGGGFNGGGSATAFGGGGGGASDVRSTSIHTVADNQLADPGSDSRLVVAAGAGGGAKSGSCEDFGLTLEAPGGPGGNAGAAGSSGETAFCSSGGSAGGGGGAGSPSAGGAFGVNPDFAASNGHPGSRGLGGDGGTYSGAGQRTGGGGGGGYFGGGGGADAFKSGDGGGGGGGGSSLVPSEGTGPTVSAAAASVSITYVVKNTTTLALAASPPAASTAGQSVTLTATLSGATAGSNTAPGGTVEFTSNGTDIPGCSAQPATAAAGGTFTATCTTSGLASGTDTLGAAYTGDDHNDAATAPTLTYAVNPSATPTPPATPTCATDGNPFTDVTPANPFCDDIDWAKVNKIAAGNTDGSFTPRASVLREAMAGFLYRYEHPGVTAPACTTAPFTDVPTTDVFCGDIAALKAEGVIAGNGDGTFAPATAVSRQTMAAFLYRIANPNKTAPACAGAPFPDVAVSNVFCGDITYLVSQKVTGGYPDGGFHPTTAVARQEMAAFLHRLYTATH